MLGGLYGDLAADTYLRDPNIFYERLFDDKAVLSEYGLSILATYKFVNQAKSKTDDRYEMFDIARRMITEADYKVALVSDKAKAWANEYFAMGYLTASGMYLNRLATFYGITDTVANEGWAVADIHSDKAEGYANIFMGEIIMSLRNGLSKDETYAQMNPVLKDCRRNWNWKELEDPISLLVRAWDCFYNSFDFGSAIHNAVRYPNSYTRQIASLTGLIAESMYGCYYYFKKKQFCNNTEQYIQLTLPTHIKDYYSDIFSPPKNINDLWERRIFFPKNCALTNVDRHHFAYYPSKLNNLQILPESRKKILRAFPTGWDDRFGFYLDNGWIYCYRSFYLLGRFKLIEKDGRYAIADVQQTEEMPNGMNIDQCITCALHSARVPEAPSLKDVE